MKLSNTIHSGAEKRVCVIGAGLTGLTAAYRLAQKGYSVLVLESMLESGGLISSFRLGSEKIEYIYHHVFTSDHDLIDLCRELGLEDHISWHSVREAVLAGRKQYSFSTPLDLLRFKEIPFPQRIRTGLAVLKAGRIREWKSLEHQTASEWLLRTGDIAYEKLWEPLLRSKFDRDSDKISAVWIWNKFKLRGSSRGGMSRKSQLGYMKGGFSTLINALEKSIIGLGGNIKYGHTAMNIKKSAADSGDAGFTVSCILDNCTTRDVNVDAVIATVSCRQFANISSGLNLTDSYMNKLRNIHYKADLCLIMRLKHSLSPYYWTTVCDDLPYVVAVEHTNLTGQAPYGGSVLYLSRYLDVGDSLWIQSDGEIFRLFSEALARMYPDFNISAVIDWRLRRTRYAQPVIERNYTRLMPGLDTPEAGVKLAGMAQIYPEDRGMNYAVRLAGQAVGSIAEYFQDE